MLTIEFIIGLILYGVLVYIGGLVIESTKDIETKNIVMLICFVFLYYYIQIAHRIISKSWNSKS